MRVVMFCHSLVSCWNHGNAHFLRGVTRELLARGHEVAVFEPRASWSRQNLIQDHGMAATKLYHQAYPELESCTYDESLDVAEVTSDADLVLVHEWTDPELVSRIGRERRRSGFRLLFHDTHHRSVSAPHEMRKFDLSNYDGALVFGQAVQHVYEKHGLAANTWVWHEAADTSLFFPRVCTPATPPFERVRKGELVWIGNFGDSERTRELEQFLLQPARELSLATNVWGVRYPQEALAELEAHGVSYHGWLPNHRVADVFSQHQVTVHVPRRPYATLLPGVPTIRVFEALACGIPLVSGPWSDTEGLFRVGEDFLMVSNTLEATRAISAVLHDPELRASLVKNGLETIRTRHTVAHRVDELLELVGSLGVTCLGPPMDRRPVGEAANWGIPGSRAV